jgi:hypothetical protein
VNEKTRGERILREDPVSPPGNAHGGRVAVTHYRGQEEDIISMTGMVKTDSSGWSRPICVARKPV